MRRMATRLGVALLLVLPCLAQDKGPKAKEIEEFRRRTAITAYQADGVGRVKATVDETCLYDGPGKNARIDVESSARLAGQLFLSVRVDGEEAARVWTRSLAKPIKLPPTTIADPDSVGYSSSAQLANGKSSCKIDLTGLPGRATPLTVYEGPGSEVAPKVVGKSPKRWYSIVVDTETVYFVPVVPSSPVPQAKKDAGSPQPEDTKLTHEEAVARVVARINKYRKAVGLSEVTEDKELSKGCQLHSEYLVVNDGRPEIQGLLVHREEKELARYSDSGAKAASRSNVGYAGKLKGIEWAIDGQIATFYHRLGFLEPGLVRVGVGIDKYPKGARVLVVDLSEVDYRIQCSKYPLLYPQPDQDNIPLVYGLGEGEEPEPVRNAERFGYPITLWGTYGGWVPGEAVATLATNEGLVESWVFTREHPALRDREKPDTVCIIPKAPLRPATLYTVTVRCKQYRLEKTPEWSKSWSFTTEKETDSKK